MTDAAQQKQRALEGGYLPTRGSLYDDPEVQERVPIIRLGREAIESTRPRPVFPYYSGMSLAMQEQFKAFLKGDLSPEDAAKSLEETITSRGWSNVIDYHFSTSPQAAQNLPSLCARAAQ